MQSSAQPTRQTHTLTRSWSQVVVCLLTILLPAYSVKADHTIEHKVEQIKIAFLVNFIRFTSWPEHDDDSKDAPLIITVIDKDDFAQMLKSAFPGAMINNRKIVINNIENLSIENDRIVPEMARELLKSHVIYMRKSTPDELEAVRQLSSKPGFLLLGDMPDFAESGGMIGFRRANSGVTFTVNIAEIRRASIRVSSKVLRLGVVVYQKSND